MNAGRPELQRSPSPKCRRGRTPFAAPRISAGITTGSAITEGRTISNVCGVHYPPSRCYIEMQSSALIPPGTDAPNEPDSGSVSIDSRTFDTLAPQITYRLIVRVYGLSRLKIGRGRGQPRKRPDLTSRLAILFTAGRPCRVEISEDSPDGSGRSRPRDGIAIISFTSHPF